MAEITAALTLTRTSLDWHEITGSDFTSLSPTLTIPDTALFKSVWIRLVSGGDISVRYRGATGDGGAAVAPVGSVGRICLPQVEQGLGARQSYHGKSLTLGNEVIEFTNGSGIASAGDVIEIGTKSTATITAEVVALMTIANTGIADIEAAASNAEGVIYFQSDAVDVTAIATTVPGCVVEGLLQGGHLPLAATENLQLVLDTPCNTISIRPSVVGAVVMEFLCTFTVPGTPIVWGA